MDGVLLFLDTYGLAAACIVMLVKAMGVPIPIPGDVILLATAARAAEGKIVLWLAFVTLLLALTMGGTVQFLLARGPARRLVYRFGHRLGLTRERLDRVARRVQQGGLLGIGFGVLTPGVRSAVIPACGIAGLPMKVFVPGLTLGSSIDIGLHFALGYVGAELLTSLVEPSPLLIVPVLALVGLGVWLLIGRRRQLPRARALDAWAQATCPVCLVVGSINQPQEMRYAGSRGVGPG
jgi:membrane protein DedA with SNARE-associated domain